MEPPLPFMKESRYDGQARIEPLRRRDGQRSFEYLTLGKPAHRFLEPGDYAVVELIVGKSWTRVENAPFAVFRARGGEVVYLGTFEHVQDYTRQHARHVTETDIALVDLDAARERLARRFPELARRLTSRTLKSDFIRARKPRFGAN